MLTARTWSGPASSGDQLQNRNPFLRERSVNPQRESVNLPLQEGDFKILVRKSETPAIEDQPSVSALRSISFGDKKSPTILDSRAIQYPFSPLSLDSLASPSASQSYQFDQEYVDKQAYRRAKAIEELIETERNFVDSLQLLLTMYIEPLLRDLDYKFVVPLVYIDSYINMMLKNHHQLLERFETTYFEISNQTEGTLENEDGRDALIYSVSTAMAFSKLIVRHAISIYPDQNFCLLSDQIMGLLHTKSCPFLSKLNDSNKGNELFVDALRSEGQKMDLSFVSLFQKPATRIPKYRLILESLLEHTPLEVSGDLFNDLETFKEDLCRLNDEINRGQLRQKRHNILFQRLNCSRHNSKIAADYFETGPDERFDFKIFGTPIFSGVLGVISIGTKWDLDFEYHICVLFKSFFLVLMLSPAGLKYDIKFMIPLSTVAVNSLVGGLILTNRCNFKITFESEFQLFELLLVTEDEAEQQQWTGYLDVLVNHITGPYKFDYSASKEKQLIYIPPSLAPTDVCLQALGTDKWSCFRKRFKTCYFNHNFQVNLISSSECSQYSSVEGGTNVWCNEQHRSELLDHLGEFWTEEQIGSCRRHSSKRLARRASVVFSNLFKNIL